MKLFSVKVKLLWLQSDIGLCGYIGAVLMDGTQVALCSKEKWDLGDDDSLRKGWDDNVRHGVKIIYCDISETELRERGLGRDKLRMKPFLE